MYFLGTGQDLGRAGSKETFPSSHCCAESALRAATVGDPRYELL